MASLAGKVALITGAAGEDSIGRAIALQFASEGADIAINDLGKAGGAADLAAALERVGSRTAVVLGDISNVSECRRVVGETVSSLGRIDILVNNAGGGIRRAFAQVSEADFDQQVGVNLKGPFFLAQAAAPHLRGRSGACIINISSEMAYLGEPDLASYAAAKAALRSLTRSLAVELAPEVRVNTICPGPTLTGRLRDTVEFSPENVVKVPLRRWALPSDIARTALFLASDWGSVYTGQTLDPNCGVVMP
jgi:NAD(P)-dependent dehydrogenase (short-subunit alcohol dehydrogenase family)